MVMLLNITNERNLVHKKILFGSIDDAVFQGRYINQKPSPITKFKRRFVYGLVLILYFEYVCVCVNPFGLLFKCLHFTLVLLPLLHVEELGQPLYLSAEARAHTIKYKQQLNFNEMT